MPTIQFDVLVPPADATTVRDTFQNALDILADKDKITSGAVTMQEAPDVDDAVVQQLHANHRNDHDGAELADATVHRYQIVVDGAAFVDRCRPYTYGYISIHSCLYRYKAY